VAKRPDHPRCRSAILRIWLYTGSNYNSPSFIEIRSRVSEPRVSKFAPSHWLGQWLIKQLVPRTRRDLGRSPHWTDLHGNLYSSCRPRGDHVCKGLKWNFRGYRFTWDRISDFAIDPYNSASLKLHSHCVRDRTINPLLRLISRNVSLGVWQSLAVIVFMSAVD